MTADINNTTSVLKGSICVLGTDATIYVTEVHALTTVLDHIDGSVSKVTKSAPEHSLCVHKDGNDAEVRDYTVNVLRTVGSVPVNVPSGANYLSVYKSGVPYYSLYGTVNVAASSDATCHNSVEALIKTGIPL